MRGDPLASPVVESFSDYQGLALKVTINFDNATHALTNVVVTRDLGCLWGTLIVGNPVDGTAKTFTVADGSTSTVNAKQLSHRGLNTIEDVLALQITAAA